VWYFVVFHRCWNWPDSVVFCCFSIGTVLSVWYFVVFHRCWNCTDIVVFFLFFIGTVLTVVFRCFSWMLELFWQCGIMLFLYWNSPDSVVLCYFSIGTVLTVWYWKITKYNTVRTVPTSVKNNKMWYFVVFHRCWNWPDSVVFCCFFIGTVLTVWYCVIFLLDFGTVLTVVPASSQQKMTTEQEPSF
jgi:hypothetical protein